MLRNIITRKLGFTIALTSILIGLTGLVFSSYKIYAATISAGTLQIEYDGTGALFNEVNIAPGFSTTKTIKVTNTGFLPHSFSIAVDKPLGPLANVLHIKASHDGSDVWDKTISEIAKYSNSEPIIGSLTPGVPENVQFIAYLPESVGNEYMGKSTFAFDFVVGTESTDMPEPSGFTTPPVSFFRRVLTAITYSPPASDQTQNSVSTPAATGAVDQVAGAQTLGAATVAKELCFWWLIILIILIISLVLYHRYNKKSGRLVVWWLWPILFAGILYVAHFYVDKNYQQTIFCHWFWAIEIVILIIYFVLELRAKEE